MSHDLKNFLRSESGATATEYAFLAACIAVVVAATLSLIGSRVNVMFADAAQVFN